MFNRVAIDKVVNSLIVTSNEVIPVTTQAPVNLGSLSFNNENDSLYIGVGQYAIPISGGSGAKVTLIDSSDGPQIYSLPVDPNNGYTETVRMLYNRGDDVDIVAPIGTALLTPTDNIKTFYYDSETDPNNPVYRILGNETSFFPTTLSTVLVGQGNSGASEQGYSVALSADGSTCAIGGQADNSNIGAVWIFIRSDGIWTQQGSKLVGTGYSGPDVYQGCSVSLSADGDTLAFGGYQDNGGVSGIGATWVFTRSGGVWTQQGLKLVGSGYSGPTAVSQGGSVSLSADGNTIAIGGPGDNGAAGAMWIFTRSGGNWTQQGNKLVTGTAAIQQGWSVSLSADANTLAVGAFIANEYIGETIIYN